MQHVLTVRVLRLWKTGFPPHLEKQGQTWKSWKNREFGDKIWKNIEKPKKNFDLTLKKAQEPQQKKHLEKKIQLKQEVNYFV